MRVQVNLENLLNRNYFPDAHSNDNISTGEPLNARFTVSARFSGQRKKAAFDRLAMGTGFFVQIRR